MDHINFCRLTWLYRPYDLLPNYTHNRFTIFPPTPRLTIMPIGYYNGHATNRRRGGKNPNGLHPPSAGTPGPRGPLRKETLPAPCGRGAGTKACHREGQMRSREPSAGCQANKPHAGTDKARCPRRRLAAENDKPVGGAGAILGTIRRLQGSQILPGSRLERLRATPAAIGGKLPALDPTCRRRTRRPGEGRWRTWGPSAGCRERTASHARLAMAPIPRYRPKAEARPTVWRGGGERDGGRPLRHTQDKRTAPDDPGVTD